MADEQQQKINPFPVVFLLLLSVIFFSIIFTIIEEYKTLKEKNQKLETKLAQFDMYYHEKYNLTLRHEIEGVTGLYVGDYFMVWVKDREYSEVMETCNHEYLHHKYRTDWEHFRKNDGGK